MVKAVDINKDIRSIAAKVGTAVFSYDEIHNENIKNTFHYDYQKVIDEVSRIHGKDMTDELIEQGILKPLPNGEYKVDVGSTTRGGGGLNYNGTAFFFMAKDDYAVKYHELAHSLQLKYDLFNKETQDVMFAQSGEYIKEDSQLINKSDYALYLNEMHSESFSHAALMLRASGRIDFAKQAFKTYISGAGRNFASFLNIGKPEYGGGNNDTKYYTTYSVLRETIKQVRQIRKAGKTGDYFDENGVLKDEKLARDCEAIVMKSAYTPRTLSALFKNKWGYKKISGEQGWRTDTFKSIASIPLAITAVYEDSKVVKKIAEHARLVKKENKLLKDFMNTPYQGNDKETAALNSYAKLMVLKNEFDCSSVEIFAKTMIRNGGCSDVILNSQINKLHKADILSTSDIEPAHTFLQKYNETLKQNKDNPYFMALVTNNVSAKDAFQMLEQKKQNPEVSVVSTEMKEPEKAYGYYAVRPLHKQIQKAQAFSLKYPDNPEFKNFLIYALTRRPEMLDSPEMKDTIMKRYAPKRDKKKFEKELNLFLTETAGTYFYNKGNPKYMEALKELSTVKLPEVYHRVIEMREQEENAVESLKAKRKAKKNDVQTIKPAEEKEPVAVNNEAAGQIYDGMKDLLTFGQKHDPRGQLGTLLCRAFIKGENNMSTLQFWGQLANQFSNASPEGKGVFVQDCAKLMKSTMENIATGSNMPDYVAAKKEIAKEQLPVQMYRKAKELSAKKAPRPAQQTDMSAVMTAKTGKEM